MIEIEVRNLQYPEADWEPIENWKSDLGGPEWYQSVLEAIEAGDPLRLDEDEYTLIVDPYKNEITLLAQCTIPGREDMEFTDVALEYRVSEPMILELSNS